MKKILGVVFGILFLTNLVSAYSYSNISPSELMENEWAVFGGIFLLVFALVYLALVNFFTQKSKGKYPWSKDESVLQNQGAIAIISLVIALFTASAFVQQGWMYGLFGEALATWILLVTLIVVVILTIPFYRVLKTNIGTTLALIALIVGIWAIIKFGFSPYDSGVFNIIEAPYQYYEIYDFISSTATLVIGLIIFGVIGLMKTMKKR